MECLSHVHFRRDKLGVNVMEPCKMQTAGPPGFLRIWGEWSFIFRELGSTGNYFRGAREQAHNFGDLGSLAKMQKKKKKKNK